jgi:hypothetical protein
MNDCPNCEYHRNRAARWRAEAYAQAGHDIIERPWVGLTADEMEGLYQLATYMDETDYIHMLMMAEAKLKEKNEQIKNT